MRDEAVRGRADAQWGETPRAQHMLHRLLGAVRQIVGAPDYERYLEHHAACHPERRPLSAREYYADFVTRRFGSGPTRCC